MELVDPYSNIDVIPLTDYLDIIDPSVVEEEINGMSSTYPFALVRIPNLHDIILNFIDYSKKFQVVDFFVASRISPKKCVIFNFVIF